MPLRPHSQVQSHNADGGDTLFVEQIKLIYANALPSTIAILVVALLGWVGLQNAVPAHLLNTWAIYMLLVAGFRLSLYFALQRGFDEHRIHLWSGLIIASAASAGIGWAGVSLFAQVASDPAYQVIVVMIVLGIMAATVPVLSALLTAFYLASIPPAVTLLLVIASWDIEGTTLLLSGLTIYTALVVYTARNTNRILLQILRLQRDKQGLINDLNAEICERKDAQAKIELHQRELETTVKDRTRQLTNMNRELEHEIAVRIRSERELQEKKSRLQYVAFHDPLTSLPNRVLLAERLQATMAQVQRWRQRLAVAYLDLDGFKAINDRYGHEVGDQFLISLGRRLKEVLREVDTIARLGGDEFVAVLVGFDDTRDSIPLLNRMLATASQPVHVGDLKLQISASIGVTFYPQEGDVDADQLLRQSDQAMYKAKLNGRNRYHFFEPESDRDLRIEHESVEHIQEGFQRGEFRLHYQPKVNMRTGEVLGVEALVRWQHPQRGLLEPAVFLPLIENRSLAIEFDRWVIDQVLTQLAAWRAGGRTISVSVNIGALFLQADDFVDQLDRLLGCHPEVDNTQLQLEVLETSALEDITQVSEVIRTCKDKGILFALDDFGTGYSSLTYLKLLPAEFLKIDRSFVRDMLDDPEDLAILEGVLGLATAFRRTAIAEGVESIEHGKLLLQLGCDVGQGNEIAEPMPPQQLLDWLDAWRPDPAWVVQEPVSRAELPLLFAGVEHRAWVRGIEQCVDVDDRIGDAGDDKACRFGQWLRHAGAARYGSRPNFSRVEDLHRQVHEVAGRLCAERNGVDASERKHHILRVQAIREQLLVELDVLRSVPVDTHADADQRARLSSVPHSA